MPATDSPAILVARFLKANQYDETLDAFIKEAGLQADAGATGPGDWTLEKILEEKKQYDTSLNYEKKNDEGEHGWTIPAPSSSHSPADLSIGSNILCVNGDPSAQRILVTAADRKCHILLGSPPYTVHHTEFALHDSPVLSLKPLGDGRTLATSMSGALALYDVRTNQVVDSRRDHAKYTVQVVACQDHGDFIIATAGWDQKVHIYAGKCPPLEEPIHTMTLPSNPESLVFAKHPDTGILHLIVSRRDSTHLYYYSITPESQEPSSARSYAVGEVGRQNLAPHSNAWISFTPSSLAPSPTDPTLLAVATSHLPHMKLIVVRLLFPESTSTLQRVQHLTQASATRANLALQDREDTAISLHVSTLAPQTPYSTPQVVWRPDGSGVWVNGDDGVIRGIEAKTGKVVALLKGHEAGTKVRTLWAGRISGKPDDEMEREVLISGGFDKRVFVWEVDEENS